LLLLCRASLAEQKAWNLLRNGSFEVGWCHEIGRHTRRTDSTVPDASWLTDEAAYHGSYCLKLREIKDPYHGIIKPAGDTFRGYKFFTIPFVLKGVGTYQVRLWAKAVEDEAKLSISALYPYTRGESVSTKIEPDFVPGGSATATLTGDQWKQLKVTVPSGNKQVHLALEGVGVYVDAIEVLPEGGPKASQDMGLGQEEGEEGEDDELEDEDLELEEEKRDWKKGAGRFTPAAAVEAGILDRTLGRIHYQEEQPIKFPVRLYNVTKKRQQAIVAYQLMNHENTVVAEGELKPLSTEAGGHATAELMLPKVSNAMYSLKYWVKGGERAWGELTFPIMPKPDPERIAPTGLLCNMTPYLIEMMKRAGLRHFASLNSSAFRLKGEYNHETKTIPDRTKLAKMAADAGFVMCMAINPWWWDKPADPPWHPPLPSRHPAPGPDPESWVDAVDKFAKMYAPYCKVWWIQDELEGHAHPHEFLPMYLKTVEVIRKHRPDAEFFISAITPWLDAFERLGGLEQVDWIGGSTMGREGRKFGWLAERHGKRYWAAAGCFTEYQTFSRLRGGKIHSSTHLRNGLIYSFFLHRASATMQYTARACAYSWTMARVHWNLLEADNTMTCALALYSITGQMLAGAKPDRDPLDIWQKHGGGYVWGFQDGRTDRPAVCFFPGEERTVEVPLKPEQLELRDPLDNVLKIEQSPDGNARFDLQRAYYFLYGNGLDAKSFRGAIRSATTSVEETPKRDLFAYYVPDEENTLKIARTYVNRGKERWDGGLRWRRAVFTDDPIPAQSTRTVFQPLEQPYTERLPLRSRQTIGGRVWLSTARPMQTPPKLDGDFSEWQPVASSALYLAYYSLSTMDEKMIHGWKNSYKVHWDYGMDYRVEWWAGYDADSLYVCARVFDDELVAADHPVGGKEPDCLELQFDRDISGDLLDPSPDDDLSVWLTPDAKGTKLRLESSDPDGERRPFAGRGVMRIWDDPKILKAWEPWPHPGPHVGYLIEVSLPWKELGIEPSPGAIVGFDLFGHETDTGRNELEVSILRWAGGAKPCGQLRLGTMGTEGAHGR